MKFSPPSDIWKVGIVHAPIHTMLTSFSAPPVTWLPDQNPFCFIADPFAIRKNGLLSIMAEAYDYRTKKGRIDFFQYDTRFQLVEQGTAFAPPFHVSYPFLLEDSGEIYMLPEAHKSGVLTLYRARHFPDVWEKVTDLLALPAIDATILHVEDRWWMFFALPGTGNRAVSELHLAYAHTLTGPWKMHAANPVRTDITSSRMGGTPFMHENNIYIPTQDCSKTYGGGVTLLRIDVLTETQFSATPVRHMLPEYFSTDYADGLHTLSACGEITLFDVKKIHRSPMRHFINLKRRILSRCG